MDPRQRGHRGHHRQEEYRHFTWMCYVVVSVHSFKARLDIGAWQNRKPNTSATYAGLSSGTRSHSPNTCPSMTLARRARKTSNREPRSPRRTHPCLVNRPVRVRVQPSKTVGVDARSQGRSSRTPPTFLRTSSSSIVPVFCENHATRKTAFHRITIGFPYLMVKDQRIIGLLGLAVVFLLIAFPRVLHVSRQFPASARRGRGLLHWLSIRAIRADSNTKPAP